MTSIRRLPSADWFAFCVGLVAFALQSWWGWAWAVAMAAIVIPSILREIGLLKDGDEFLLGVAHRAAFHAMVCAVFLIFMARALRAAAVSEGFSPGESMKLVEGAFLVSYLLQYWGAREGAFRVFLGAAALTLLSLLAYLQPASAEVRVLAIIVVSIFAAVLTGLSFLIRARPRLCGVILVTISVLMTGFFAWFSFAATPYPQPWAFVVGGAQFTLLFGCTGLALWRESRSRPELPPIAGT